MPPSPKLLVLCSTCTRGTMYVHVHMHAGITADIQSIEAKSLCVSSDDGLSPSCALTDDIDPSTTSSSCSNVSC